MARYTLACDVCREAPLLVEAIQTASFVLIPTPINRFRPPWIVL